MSAHYEDGRLGAVARYGRQPEVKPRMLVPQPRVPHQQVDGAVRQEELDNNSNDDVTSVIFSMKYYITAKVLVIFHQCFRYVLKYKHYIL